MGGSGGGGSSNYSGIPSNYAAKLSAELLRLREQVGVEADKFLSDILLQANSRNSELAKARLSELMAALESTVEVEGFLYGGSVAKHTAVEGVSDVDALLLIDSDSAFDARPGDFVRDVAAELSSNLSAIGVSVIPGDIAVTVQYADGQEFQLLPATRHAGDLFISSSGGTTWQSIEPHVFREALTKANQNAKGSLVPAIKLYKAINVNLPPQKQLSGYHIEALAVESGRNFEGPFTPRAMLNRFLDRAADRVLTPLADQTGQSKHVDASLGEANSFERRIRAQTLIGIKRRLDSATSVADWRALFGM